MNRVFCLKLLIVFAFVLLSQIIRCQTIELYNPISLPPSISGSFGEIRSDHFHSGVDFRTNGKTGLRVYASEIGFISRIKVSSVGFGKTLYIEHPNGLTTVYAHLDRFAGKLAQYVENAQYTQKSFEVEVFPGKDELIIKKGEIIAFSGNSGSSGGPHLHYEARHTSSQVPVAPLMYFENWRNTDTSAPTINSIFIYKIDSLNYLMDSLERKSLKFTKSRNQYRVNDTIYTLGKVGLGAEIYDYVNEKSNRCGFQEISLSVNNQITYKLNLDSFAFAETKYVNSIIDYQAKTLTNEEVVQLWVDDNNKFSGLKYDSSRGFINVEYGKIYNILITLKDHSGNKATMQMVLKGKKQQIKELTIAFKENSTLLEFDREHKISTNKYEISIPRNALYHNIIFHHSLDSTSGKQTIYRVHNSKTPIHKKFVLRIKQPTISTKYLNKTYIGYINGKGTEFIESRILNGNIEANCSKFGNYIILIDTIPPQVKPINIFNKARLTEETQLKIQLTDETGIKTYKGYIDNNWVLFEWDPKSKTLYHNLDKKRIKPQAWHNLNIEVTDNLNNRTEFTCEFFW